MQIVINRQELLSVLKRAGAAVNSSDMLTIRQSILIGAESGKPMTFGATNGDLSIVCRAKGEVKGHGSAVLNYKRLTSIVNELPQGEIEILVDAKFKVTLRSSASKRKFTMTSLTPEDFPPMKERPGEPLYSVEAKILQQASKEVEFAISEGMTKGALLVPAEDKFFQLITLGRYACAVATGWFTERGAAAECLLPQQLLDAADAFPKDTVLSLSMDSSNIFISTDDTLVRATQLQMSMVDMWRQILAGIPKEKRFRVSSDLFLESVKAVSVAADFVEGSEKDRVIQIDVTCTEGSVVIATRRSELNHGEDELAVIDAGPGNFRFHVDGLLMSKALRSFSPGELDLYYNLINGKEALYLKNETLTSMVLLIADIPDKPPAGKK